MIRKATHADLDAIVSMGERFYATTSYATWAPFCPETSRALGEMIIETGVLLVADVGDRLVGMVGLLVAPSLFNASVKAAYEVFWWIEPEHRGGLTAWRLLQAIEPACREAGCRSIQMVALSTSPVSAEAMYRRAGYKHSESSHTKILEA